jgi:hypothetical protein
MLAVVARTCRAWRDAVRCTPELWQSVDLTCCIVDLTGGGRSRSHAGGGRCKLRKGAVRAGRRGSLVCTLQSGILALVSLQALGPVAALAVPNPGKGVFSRQQTTTTWGVVWVAMCCSSSC